MSSSVSAQSRDVAPEQLGGELRLSGVHHAYGDVVALAGIDLEVAPGECVALLGPSGCGKSTLLNAIAGFVTPSRGDISFRGDSWAALPPNERGVGFVFQSYALFPHLRIRQNIGYGLTVRKLPRATVAEAVERVAGLLHIGDLLDRFPGELSGGQQQRVALARALAIEPSVLLLDEALSALDRGLREQMQVEISLLQRELGITTIVVTHDTREAFSLGDRIAVMRDGRIEQIGSPRELYAAPATPFVLGFLGATTRVEDLPVEGPSPHVVLGQRVVVPTPTCTPGTDRVDLLVRGDQVSLEGEPTSQHRVAPATVELATFLGGTVRYVVRVGDVELVVEQSAFGPRAWYRGDQVYVHVESTGVAVEPRGA